MDGGLIESTLKAIDTTTDAETTENGDGADEGELTAALVFARKRRLGPFRPAALSCESPPEKARSMPSTKELQKFALAGFSFDVAKRVLSQNARVL